jgi:hypothetical protein
MLAAVIVSVLARLEEQAGSASVGNRPNLPTEDVDPMAQLRGEL